QGAGERHRGLAGRRPPGPRHRRAGGWSRQSRGDRAPRRGAVRASVLHRAGAGGDLARQMVPVARGRRAARMITPIRWGGDRLLLLDQTLLPVEERVREYASWRDVAEAIRSLVVRGAPAIGCA